MNTKWTQTLGIAFAAFVFLVLSQTMAIWLATGKPNNVGKFNLASERLARDLDGKSVSLMLNQVWPFEASQNINVQIVTKKQMDEYVVVFADVKALAAVQQQPDTPKEQFSTTPTGKDVPKTAKLPSKLQLMGRMKLTYELVDNEWYLLTVENLSLRPIPID
jgi:hypothetical protein